MIRVRVWTGTPPEQVALQTVGGGGRQRRPVAHRGDERFDEPPIPSPMTPRRSAHHHRVDLTGGVVDDPDLGGGPAPGPQRASVPSERIVRLSSWE